MQKCCEFEIQICRDVFAFMSFFGFMIIVCSINTFEYKTFFVVDEIKLFVFQESSS